MTVFLSLGANLGNREETLNKALELLSEQVGPLIKRSSFFYTEPWGFDSPNDFCNLCASFETSLTPTDLLCTTQAIELQLGRQKELKKWSNGQMRKYSDRSIDIDILLLFDDAGQELTVNCHLSPVNYLIVPHPLMQKRDFVMIPLREIAPDLPLFSKK